MTMKTTVLTDIEGTTSAISFVRDVLFPYARRQLQTFEAAEKTSRLGKLPGRQFGKDNRPFLADRCRFRRGGRCAFHPENLS